MSKYFRFSFLLFLIVCLAINLKGQNIPEKPFIVKAKYGVLISNHKEFKYTKFLDQGGQIYFGSGFLNIDSLKEYPYIKYVIVSKNQTIKYNYNYKLTSGIDTVYNILNNESNFADSMKNHNSYEYLFENTIRYNYILGQVLSTLKSNYIYAIINENEAPAGLTDKLPHETYSIFQYDDSIIEGINFYYYVLKSSDTSGFKIVEKDSCIASTGKQFIKGWMNESIKYIQSQPEDRCNTPIIDHLLIYKNKVYFLSWDCVQPRKASKVLRNASRIASGLDFIRSYSIYHNKRHAPY